MDISQDQIVQSSSESNKSEDIILNNLDNFKSIKEIKRKAELFNQKPEEYKAIFDIDPNNNKILIDQMFKSNKPDNEKVNFFYDNMYFLTTDARENLYKNNILVFNNIKNQADKKAHEKLKGVNLVQTGEIKQVFKNVLNFMNKTDNPNNLINSLQHEYYINFPSCFIPLNEGNDNIIFTYLINVIYIVFCVDKSEPKNNSKTIKKYDYQLNNFNKEEDKN